MGRVCVYTAIFGGYDTLKPMPEQDVSCDFVCFTDNPRLPTPGRWQIVHAPILPEAHPRMRAKFFKVRHDQVFRKGRRVFGRSIFERLLDAQPYDYTIWIDGSIQVKNASFAREFCAHVGAAGWSMFIHPERNCIYPEAEVSLTMPKYFQQPIAAQIEAYRRENYPTENGLFATGLIARARAAHLAAIGEMWWSEQLRWSYQDQLSLPVVLWRLKRGCDLVRKDLWSNEWFDWVPHGSEL